jgi:hypothetical protein
MEVMRMLSSS